MATQITAYKASNGKIFEIESEVDDYEIFLVEKNAKWKNVVAEVNEFLDNQRVRHRDDGRILQIKSIYSEGQSANLCVVDTTFINCIGMTQFVFSRIKIIGEKYKIFNLRLPWWTREDAENDLGFKLF